MVDRAQVMNRYCDLTSEITDEKDRNRPACKRLSAQIRELKCDLLPLLDAQAVDKLIITRMPDAPEICIRRCMRQKQSKKITPELACQAWQDVYTTEALRPFRTGGETLAVAVSKALQEHIEKNTYQLIPFADVVCNGSAADKKGIGGAECTRVAYATQNAADVAHSLWMLKQELVIIRKKERQVVKPKADELKTLETQVAGILSSCNGASQQVTHRAKPVYLRTKFATITPSMNIKSLDGAVDKPILDIVTEATPDDDGGLPAVSLELVSLKMQHAFRVHVDENTRKRKSFKMEEGDDGDA